MEKPIDMTLTVVPENFARESVEWAEICTQLREQLNAEDGLIASVPPPTNIPTDAKGEPITIGALIIALASAPAVIKLAHSLNTWITSLGSRKVRLELKMRGQSIVVDSKGLSAKEVQKLVSLARAVSKKP